MVVSPRDLLLTNTNSIVSSTDVVRSLRLFGLLKTTDLFSVGVFDDMELLLKMLGFPSTTNSSSTV